MPQNKYKRENLAAVLRRHGINPTHQRIEIAHAIFSRGEHLSAEQILVLVNERASETSKATVYNTLNLFLDKKLIRGKKYRMRNPKNVVDELEFLYKKYREDRELTDIDA